MSWFASLQAAGQSDTASGWYGFFLALLNVVQTVALAFLAGSRRRDREEKSARSR